MTSFYEFDDKDSAYAAISTAKRSLKNCFVDDGIIAGVTHFDDFWARDSFFASWGALEFGEVKRVRKNLNLFMFHQRSDGMIPRKLNRYRFIPLKYFLGIRINRKELLPVFKSISGAPTIDSNPLFIITAEKYVSKSGDIDWLIDNQDRIKKAVNWILFQDGDKDYLIEEGPRANWMDTITKFEKEGTVFYSNVLFYQALRSWRKCLDLLEQNDERVDRYLSHLPHALENSFWTGEFFADWRDHNKRYDYFATDGNFLGVALGLFNKTKAEKILESFERMNISSGYPSTNYPEYPNSFIRWHTKFFGLKGYQNNYAVWLWIQAVRIVALLRAGKKNDAIHQLNKVIKLINAYSAIHEVYTPKGRLYRRGFWSSETSLAWSSGLILWAFSEFEKAK